MTSSRIRLAAVGAMLGAGAAMAAPLAAAQSDGGAPEIGACLKAVNAMGASMGHDAASGPDGRPAYHFVVRTNGLDYDVVCDAATGVVEDVSRRTASETGSN
jgi:hypothetical protein